jgi:hypothetical protein
VDVINAASAAAVSCAVDFGSANAADVVTVTLSDGVLGASTPSQPVVPSGTVTFTGTDASAFADGAVAVSVNVVDPAGNVTTWAGTPAMKDTLGPLLVVDPVTSPTAAGSQAVTGESEAAATIAIAGGSAPASGAADGAGRFSLSVPLASGSNALAVTATDASGNPVTQTLDWNGAALMVVQNAAAPPVAFVDATAASGLGGMAGVAGGSFQDVDGDGDLDLFAGGANRLWLNNGSGVFSDATAMLGGAFASPTTSAVFADADGDGDLDLAAVDGSSLVFLRNDVVPSGTLKFLDETALSGASASGTLTACFWADLDQDGRCDLVATDSDPAGPEVRLNLPSGFNAVSPFGPARTQMLFGVVADLVPDGRPDFVFGDAAPGFFYRNDSGGAFTDIAGGTSGVSLHHKVIAGGILAADYDNDGDADLFAAAGGADAPSASCGGCPLPSNLLFQNGGAGAFAAMVGGQSVGLLAGIEPPDGWSDLCAGDVDNDGRLDLLVGRGAGNRLFLNVGDLAGADGVFEFLEVSAACGLAGSTPCNLVQMADLDGDGDLDLFTPNGSGANEVWMNGSDNFRNLTVKVAGIGAGGASLDAIGARVELRDAAGTAVLATREISGGRGMGSQDPLRAHFGVTPSAIYTVRVVFPSGVERVASNVVPRDLPSQTLLVSE